MFRKIPASISHSSRGKPKPWRREVITPQPSTLR
jgi:hypothetical protein